MMRWMGLLAVIGSGVTMLQGASVSLQPVADASLMEIAPSSSLGGATFFNSGTAGNGNRNRGLLRYDLAGSIPQQSIITSVSLTIDVVRQPLNGLENSLFEVRRVFVPWGEGTQVPSSETAPGFGGPAGAGDATWTHRFFGGDEWSQPGGAAGTDFSEVVSAATPSAQTGDSLAFETSPELISDVSFWLAEPGQNFGWMVISDSEQVGKTARSFATRESGFGPTLTVEYTLVPEPGSISLIGLAGFLVFLVTRRYRLKR